MRTLLSIRRSRHNRSWFLIDEQQYIAYLRILQPIGFGIREHGGQPRAEETETLELFASCYLSPPTRGNQVHCERPERPELKDFKSLMRTPLFTGSDGQHIYFSSLSAAASLGLYARGITSKGTMSPLADRTQFSGLTSKITVCLIM